MQLSKSSKVNWEVNGRVLSNCWSLFTRKASSLNKCRVQGIFHWVFFPNLLYRIPIMFLGTSSPCYCPLGKSQWQSCEWLIPWRVPGCAQESLKCGMSGTLFKIKWLIKAEILYLVCDFPGLGSLMADSEEVALLVGSSLPLHQADPWGEREWGWEGVRMRRKLWRGKLRPLRLEICFSVSKKGDFLEAIST